MVTPGVKFTDELAGLRRAPRVVAEYLLEGVEQALEQPFDGCQAVAQLLDLTIVVFAHCRPDITVTR